MFATVTTGTCPNCNELADVCSGRALTRAYTGEALRCCSACSHELRTYRVKRPDIEEQPFNALHSPRPMSRVDEDRVVERLLAEADRQDAGQVEMPGRLSLDAYRSLARSRDCDLEDVIRHACRNELAAIVRRPVTPPTERKPK